MACWIIFSAVTTLLLVVTFVGTREKRGWAWARFCAFELNLILILLGVGGWFRDPLSALQIASWLLLAASVVVVVSGVMLLQTRGRPDGHFENTTRLVDSGVYRYIRHPMYASLLYLAWGACLKRPEPLTIGLAVAASLAAWLTARIEERDNLTKFGEKYAAYMARTKMLIPFIH